MPDRADEGPFVGTFANAGNWGKKPSPPLCGPSPMRPARERAKPFEIIAFSLALCMGEGAQRADEGPSALGSIDKLSHCGIPRD